MFDDEYNETINRQIKEISRLVNEQFERMIAEMMAEKSKENTAE